VAPEHVCDDVLAVMKKPGPGEFEQFRAEFERYSRKAGKEQYLVPYFISSHPGATTEHAVQLMEYLQKNRWKPQQVQDFMPTPMTLASDIQWSGYHPMSGKPVHVVRDMKEKRTQKALIRWADPANAGLVEEALRRVGRLKPGERWQVRGVPWQRSGGKRVLLRRRHGEGERDRRVEDEVERDVEEGAALGSGGEPRQRAVDAVQRAVGEERDDGEQVVAGDDQHRRQHAQAEARQRHLIRRDAAPRQPLGGSVHGGLHELQGKAVKHVSPHRP
jgi:hypothetical protein